MMTEQLGKSMIVLGLLVAACGALVLLAARVPWLRLGRLPGDLVVQREGFSFYFPVVTMLALSAVLTLGLWLLRLLSR